MSKPEAKVAPWEDVVLRLIALYKFVKAGLALALGLTLFHFIHRDVHHFLQLYIAEPLHFNLDSDSDSENQFLRWLFDQAASLTPHTMRLSAYLAFFCAGVFMAEGIGLYLKKHWAEYLVIVVTCVPLPYEIYLLFHQVFWWKVCLLMGNLLIVGYLVHRLRLDYHNKKAAAAAALAEAQRKQAAASRETSPAPSAKTVAVEPS